MSEYLFNPTPSIYEGNPRRGVADLDYGINVSHDLRNKARYADAGLTLDRPRGITRTVADTATFISRRAMTWQYLAVTAAIFYFGVRDIVAPELDGSSNPGVSAAESRPDLGSGEDYIVTLRSLTDKYSSVDSMMMYSWPSFNQFQTIYYSNNPQQLVESMDVYLNELAKENADVDVLESVRIDRAYVEKLRSCIEDKVSFKECVEGRLGATIPENYQQAFRTDRPEPGAQPENAPVEQQESTLERVRRLLPFN